MLLVGGRVHATNVASKYVPLKYLKMPQDLGYVSKGGHLSLTGRSSCFPSKRKTAAKPVESHCGEAAG